MSKKIKIKKEDVASAVKVVVGATLAVAGPVLGKIGIDELKKKKQQGRDKPLPFKVMNNIFNGTGDTVQLINLIDKLLRRDGYITYDDIIKEYSPEYVGVKREKNPKVSSIKKAINTMKPS